MGKRFWIGTGILAVLLGLSLLTAGKMGAIHTPLAEAFADAADRALSGSEKEAATLALEAAEGWRARRFLTALVADHTPMDRVEELLAEMTVFAQSEDPEHFAACCRQLAAALEAIADSHAFSVENLL